MHWSPHGPGYLTAREALRCCPGCAVRPPSTPAPELLVWDVGGASFQIVGRLGKGDLQVYEGPLGASIATAMLVQDVQGKDFAHTHSPNPVATHQAKDLVRKVQRALPECPAWLSGALDAAASTTGVQVVGIGGETCVFRIAALALGRDAYRAEDVWMAVEQALGCSDEELERRGYPQPDMVVPKLATVYAAMTKLRIPEVRFLYCNGSCLGLLCSPWAWESE